MQSRWARLGRAVQFVRPHRTTVLGILALTLLVAELESVEPLILKYVFDQLGGQGGLRRDILLGVLALAVLTLTREMTTSVATRMAWRTRLSVQHSLLDATAGRLQHKAESLQRPEEAGALVARLDGGVQEFVDAMGEILENVLPSLAYLGMSIYVMLRLEWRMALLVMVVSPLPAIVGALAAPRQARRERRLLDHWAKLFARFTEVLAGIATVRSFAMENSEKARFLKGVTKANDEISRGVEFDTQVTAVQNLLAGTARIGAIAFGGFLMLRGEVTLGTLVAFQVYLEDLFAAIQELTGNYRTLQTATVSVQEVFSIMDIPEPHGDAPEAREAPALRGEISFENVSFSYEGTNRLLLDGIDLTVRPGEMVAVVGPSGSGKSTLAALLQRFHDPTSGAIRFDGVDLRELKQSSVRRQIGVVLQDALLFNDTVRDNIAYGRPDATQEQIEWAARAANVHDAICRLPEKYDTWVGERGGRFSAGERQRIAIARALLKNPPILILDEATSALDAELESQVQADLERLMRGRTTFVIAHRLSTVVNANRILVLKWGRIMESGHHAELLARNGYYAHLVAKQAQGLLGVEAA